MEDSLFGKVIDSRGIKYELLPVPSMSFSNIEYELDKMKVRGSSSTSFQRKSFSVNLVDSMIFENDLSSSYEKFKLISMTTDYTYIENRLAQLIMNELGLWPLKTFYTQVEINGEHQGLYLFIEDPEEYLIRNKNAEIVIRRYYRNGIDDYKLNSDLATNDSEYYLNLFRALYKEVIVSYSGEELYNELSKRLNISEYMWKMAVDYLIKNGDYTDELSFYAIEKNGYKYFNIIPWDFDDIFADKPHEVGTTSYVGQMFGERHYETYDDILAEIGDKLVFSIEDDIDYTIAKDDYLYNQYLNEANYVFSVLTETKIEELFSKLYNEVYHFYQIKEVVSQSRFDKTPTSRSLFEKNFEEKKKFLVERRNQIVNQIEEQLNAN